MTPQHHHELPTTALSFLSNTFTVLVVDDMKANRLLLERLLGRVGYRTIEAEDGPSALIQIEESRPDLVIMDVEMPGITGIETVLKIRASEASEKRIPIIVASGNPSSEMEAEALAAEADVFLTKPFEFDKLFSAMRELLKGRNQSGAAQRSTENGVTKEAAPDQRAPANSLLMEYVAKN